MTESDVRKRNTALRESNQQASPNPSNSSNNDKRSLWSRLNPSLLLENKGSVARDHLANERTFLAWIRTSLSLITVGVAIAQLFRLPTKDSNSKSHHNAGIPIGASFIVFGICFTFFALIRYFHAQSLMTQGKFPASRGIVIGGTVGIIALLISLFVLVLVIGAN
ncbi:hypothetical protein K493DRAFT_292954 [Basidiobolus meristosporus CBS 931.73]|uniref:DUF202 domain-containing protein n=1 Tax=Basidiobolus meristosporus CBS 931.73 TaxID=1314790 RepID=A0A1Y1X565_9FUNG|nr:hypothetical protein K493DRAFT_292954 [Basidiobolus meristosporus CBS 931.73]|eukprot:ORX80957.1 hypothetical protein K493DRAFT_292954 [Basidiobolus meristosporus CBS 931.73]